MTTGITPPKSIEQRREELRLERLMRESAVEKAKTEGRYWEAIGAMKYVRGSSVAFLVVCNRAWRVDEHEAYHSQHAATSNATLGPVGFIGARHEAIAHFATMLNVDEVTIRVIPNGL
ncbi:MAG: hypothetical protein GVY29_03825 [Spirochaetes bacterium]|jgi:hypothetical protein|nr:hypothetical protein [Spirochaetota bacterium]